MVEQARLGLALGGGGARGGAHIGLLKFLDRKRVRVSAIAGTSAGGIVGGLYAAGMSPAEIEKMLLSIRPVDILVPDPSGWSIFSTQNFIDLVRGRIGNMHIEDLPIRFAAVAVDLKNARQVVLNHGPLAVAFQATMAVPGFLGPVVQEDSLLVDGGVLNNVPVDAARALGPGKVLAVDVGVPPNFPLETFSMGGLPGPVPRIVERILTLTGRQRAALALNKSWDILTAELTARRLAENPPDLLLRPDLGSIAVADMARLTEAIDIGERMAEKHWPEIERLLEESTRAETTEG